MNRNVQQVIMQAFVTCQFYGGLKADFPEGIKDCHVINIHLVYTVDIFFNMHGLYDTITGTF